MTLNIIYLYKDLTRLNALFIRILKISPCNLLSLLSQCIRSQLEYLPKQNCSVLYFVCHLSEISFKNNEFNSSNLHFYILLIFLIIFLIKLQEQVICMFVIRFKINETILLIAFNMSLQFIIIVHGNLKIGRAFYLIVSYTSFKYASSNLIRFRFPKY